jgi:hypothetical protein
MAVWIRGKTACSICQEIIEDGQAWVGTAHFIQDDKHPLWRFSDSAMRQVCFRTWEHAEEYRKLYNEIWPNMVPHHPREMLEDGSIVPKA